VRVLVLSTSYPRHDADFGGRFLADSELRRRLGANACARIDELCGRERVIDQTVAAYEAALGPVA
jgi:hypothetical protein